MPNLLDTLIDYSRQVDMANEYIFGLPQSNIIVGAGGIGYWLALLLAMHGTKHLALIDGDQLETSNLNRIPAPPRLVGKLKVNACKAQLRLLRPGINVTCFPAHITLDTLSLIPRIAHNMAGSPIVWDCTDDARIQIELSKLCRNNYAYVKLGYEGWNVGAYRNMANTWLPDNYQPGYTSSKANVMSSCIAAALGIMYYTQGSMRDFEVNLKELVVPLSTPVAGGNNETQEQEEDEDAL